MKSAFTLVELLTVIAISSILLAFTLSITGWCITEAKASASATYLRELVQADWSYADDNNGTFCPAQDPSNTIRWHGARTSVGAQFDTTKGYLAPYLNGDGIVHMDPLFTSYVTTGSFEDGSGGYGYNEIYVGGTPQNNYAGASVSSITNPSKTVMFGTTAFAIGGNEVQEYPFCEAPQWVDTSGNLAGSLQPSLQFRANGKALVGWCDGHVTAEAMNSTTGPNYYGGNNSTAKIGWFGPTDNNGYWNPHYPNL